MSAHTVVLTGVASLVAGAFSMGTGEFISVTNQNELVGAEVLLEQQMLTRFPAAEEEELAGYFRDYGADPQTAARMAAAVSRDPATALQIHTRQELGVDPQELPSPLLAGVSSLFAFSAGAVVPLLPYLFGASSLALTLALTAVALTVGGMAVGRLHRPASAAVGPAPARLRRPGHRRHLSGRPPHRQRHLTPRKYPVSIEQVDCAIGRWGVWPARGAGALREWHCEVAVGGALLVRRLAGEVGDPNAEILRRQRQLLIVDALRVSPAPEGLNGELKLRRADLPAGPEVDVRLAVGGLDAQGERSSAACGAPACRQKPGNTARSSGRVTFSARSSPEATADSSTRP